MICEALSDRMPAVARGHAKWDAEETEHFAQCAECQAEWALVATIARRAATTTPAMDLERMVAAVVRESRSEAVVIPIASATRRRRLVQGLVGLAAAAAVTLAVYTTRPAPVADDVALVPTRVKTAIPELDALLEDELKVVLATIEDPTTDLTPGPLPRLGDLTEAELQQLLQSVEG
jgi:hypothetical protein